jgi:hypothetical protein
MAKLGFIGYLKTYRMSLMRWLVVGSIILSVFLVDFFLQKEISNEVSAAWSDACISQVSAAACMARIDSHHKSCFESNYSSMLMRFGGSRWESLKIEEYEVCMGEERIMEPASEGADKFTISGELSR